MHAKNTQTTVNYTPHRDMCSTSVSCLSLYSSHRNDLAAERASDYVYDKIINIYMYYNYLYNIETYHTVYRTRSYSNNLYLSL